MAKKANTCCFCERKYISKWGATCEDTGKTMCIDCVILIYNGILDELKQQGMDDSITEETE